MEFESTPPQPRTLEQLVNDSIEELRRYYQGIDESGLLQEPITPQSEVNDQRVLGNGNIVQSMAINLLGWRHIREQFREQWPEYQSTDAQLVRSTIDKYRFGKQRGDSVKYEIKIFKIFVEPGENEVLDTLEFDPKSDLPPGGLIVQALNYHLEELKKINHEQELETVEQEAIRISHACRLIELSLSELEVDMAGVILLHDKRRETKSNYLSRREKLLGEAALFATKNRDLLTELATREDQERLEDDAA